MVYVCSIFMVNNGESISKVSNSKFQCDFKKKKTTLIKLKTNFY